MFIFRYYLKRILYITPYYKPSWFYGGPPKCISEQAEYLVAHFECKIDVVTLNKNGQQKLFGSDEVVIQEVGGVRVHYLPASQGKLGSSYFASPQLKKYLEQFKNVDVVHIHTLFNAFPTAGASFAIRNKIPFGYSVHGMLDRYSLTRSKWMKRVHRFLYEDQHLLKADFLHFTTENEKSNSVFPRKAKTQVIPLGMVQVEFIEYARPYCPYDLNMVYLGRINRKKGLDLLLQSFLLLSSSLKGRIHLDVYGEDDDNFLMHLQQMIEFHHLNEWVSFKGKLDPEVRNEKLQEYDLLVLPSHQENFGLVVAESLDQKVPVLISDKVNLCDVVLKHQCGWVSSLAPKQLAKKIEEAFRTPRHVRQRMGANGHDFVRNSFAFEKVGNKYWDLYSNLKK